MGDRDTWMTITSNRVKPKLSGNCFVLVKILQLLISSDDLYLLFTVNLNQADSLCKIGMKQ